MLLLSYVFPFLQKINAKCKNILPSHALSRLCTFWCSSFWIGMASGVILIPRIGLNTPSWELKLRIKASLPEGRVQKCTKSSLDAHHYFSMSVKYSIFHQSFSKF